MDFLDRFGLPRKLSSRLWLITLPSAIVSFEKRSDVPKIPEAGSKAVGALLLLGGAALGVMAVRRPETSLAYNGPLAPAVERPARLAGLMGLAGVAFLLRSTMLLVYALGLTVAAGTGRMSIEEPSSATLMGRGEE
jgi:hypothetical protein